MSFSSELYIGRTRASAGAKPPRPELDDEKTNSSLKLTPDGRRYSDLNIPGKLAALAQPKNAMSQLANEALRVNKWLNETQKGLSEFVDLRPNTDRAEAVAHYKERFHKINDRFIDMLKKHAMSDDNKPLISAFRNILKLEGKKPNEVLEQVVSELKDQTPRSTELLAAIKAHGELPDGIKDLQLISYKKLEVICEQFIKAPYVEEPVQAYIENIPNEGQFDLSRKIALLSEALAKGDANTAHQLGQEIGDSLQAREEEIYEKVNQAIAGKIDPKDVEAKIKSLDKSIFAYLKVVRGKNISKQMENDVKHFTEIKYNWLPSKSKLLETFYVYSKKEQAERDAKFLEKCSSGLKNP